ncbi:hypothetical protein MSAN_00307900 [Mycena sanguinolenta]|uniref:Uncharacterized protein n=1 Tax=Mycena sanguinolenta TaxID=230812 RepID=A0A8H6Z816_9AGAR|nr:hypothetical protein MSAN_00307900 [Mycena sanguinolenta]
MPESQVLQAFAHMLQQVSEEAYRQSGFWPDATLRLFPRAFAEGTPTKPYKTLTMDSGDYSPSLEPNLRPVNNYDARRIPKHVTWRHLLDRELVSGPIYFAVRGKCLAIAAGYHALVVHFDLEGNIRPMKRTDFNDMVAHCVKGNASDPARAEKMRSFLLPNKFIEPGARKSKKDRKITILAAILMDEDVFIITDFCRMTQLHVVSSSRIISKRDLEPGSEFWTTRLWAHFRASPDWISETEAALAVLVGWREQVLSKDIRVPIIEALLDVDGPGSGMGQHLVNDFLFSIAFHPDTPSLVICKNDDLFTLLRTSLVSFMSQWASKKYLTRCAGRANSNNPFFFNDKSNRIFLQQYVRVYRKVEVRIEQELYNRYQSLGLFDPTHTIGMPYHSHWTPMNRKYKSVSVQMFRGSKSNRYHVIRAIPPAEWKAYTEPSEFSDITAAGFSTTLGPASFYESMLNKLDEKELEKTPKKRGRPAAVIKTGNSGRPRLHPRHPVVQEAIDRVKLIPKTAKVVELKKKDKKNEGCMNESSANGGKVVSHVTRPCRVRVQM